MHKPLTATPPCHTIRMVCLYILHVHKIYYDGATIGDVGEANKTKQSDVAANIIHMHTRFH